ncbi:MAG TPA: phosphatase PAP2 family protein [Chloroflexi bacterium]|nr:phosphatase PAP2 family protein [Chloroflexota bacterium]
MWRLRDLIRLDRTLSKRLAIRQEARGLRLLALLVAHSGDSPLWLLFGFVALGYGMWGGDPTWRDLGGRVMAACLVAGAVTTALKWLFRRQRPPGKGVGFYSRFDRHAFPSGHAGRTACLAVLLAPFFATGWPIVGLLAWVGVVGLARVALQVHFISDIVGGWAIGLIVGVLLSLTT